MKNLTHKIPVFLLFLTVLLGCQNNSRDESVSASTEFDVVILNGGSWIRRPVLMQ
jgi:hypothetical protein